MQVKLMHIQMCVKNVMFGKSPADAAAAWGDPYLVLLSKLMDTCTAASVRPKLLKAIGQALPGVSQGFLCSCSVATHCKF